jgi:hypothetical protein
MQNKFFYTHIIFQQIYFFVQTKFLYLLIKPESILLMFNSFFLTLVKLFLASTTLALLISIYFYLSIS